MILILSNCIERYKTFEAEDFRRPCRDHFAELFPEHERYLPTPIHYFSEKRDRFNKPLYQDTGEKPAWRP